MGGAGWPGSAKSKGWGKWERAGTPIPRPAAAAVAYLLGSV